MKLQPTTLFFVIASLLASPVYGGSIKRSLPNDTNHLQYAKRDLPDKGPVYPQLIDHTNMSNDTFEQHFWVHSEYHEGDEDAPVFLVLVGNDQMPMIKKYHKNTIIRALVKEHRGTIIFLQLRYHGESLPFDELSEDNLKYLTTDQIIYDIVRFANDVNYENVLSAKKVPWVLIGGGFSGGLVSWVLNTFPQTFAAGYSSSGTVQAKSDFWEFYDGIRRNMPKSCAHNVQTVIKYFEREVKEGRITQLKKDLGLPKLKYIDDVADIMARSLANWIKVDYVTQPHKITRFGEFCDTLNMGSEAQGDRIGKLLSAWSKWHAIHCPKECQKLDTHDTQSSLFKDLEDPRRSWRWLQCNEYGWFRTAPDSHTNPIVSQELSLERELRICRNYFPDTYLSAKKLAQPGPAANRTNAKYGGWDEPAKNVFFAVGEFDTALDISVLAENARRNLKEGNVAQLNRGHHQSDLVPKEKEQRLEKVHEVAQAFIASWVEKWWEDERRGVHQLKTQ